MAETRPRPYTPATLAERWDCSQQHIRDLINRGELPAFRVGRLIRIPHDEVMRIESGQPEEDDEDEPAKPRSVPRVIKLPNGRLVVSG